MTGESPLCQTLHLVTYYILFFIQLGSRQVHVAGVTPHPNQAWMMQVAHTITMEEWGFLSPGQYLIHDRDGKYCPAFQHIIDTAEVTRVPLPPAAGNTHTSMASLPLANA
jgi:hypothetical protein